MTEITVWSTGKTVSFDFGHFDQEVPCFPATLITLKPNFLVLKLYFPSKINMFVTAALYCRLRFCIITQAK